MTRVFYDKLTKLGIPIMKTTSQTIKNLTKNWNIVFLIEPMEQTVSI